MTEPADPRRAEWIGIVLAGGRSRRFGRDKLEERIEGRTLVDRAVDAVAAVASQVIVVRPPITASHDHGSSAASSTGDRARLVGIHDPESYGGPLVGLLAGLEAAGEGLAVVVGGDMPTLRPDVLALLQARLTEASMADAAALDDSGRVRPLPLVVRVEEGTAAARAALAAGARSLHALLDRLRVEVVAGDEWRVLDPAGDTLRDIDRPADLPADAQRPEGQSGKPSAS